MTSCRIVCMSDTHGYEDMITSIPYGDILVHAGDFTNGSTAEEIERFKRWIDRLSHKHKVFVGGNHESSLQTDRYITKLAHRFHKKLFLYEIGYTAESYSQKCKDIVNRPPSVYLQDSAHYIVPDHNSSGGVYDEGITVYGTPWQPEYRGGAFNLKRGVPLREKWSMIPSGIDILVTHTPPHGIRDRCKTGEFCGCEDLRREVCERIRPRLHVFGHIHEGYGKSLLLLLNLCVRLYCSIIRILS